jgi:hypothetical protein
VRRALHLSRPHAPARAWRLLSAPGRRCTSAPIEG